MHTTIASGDAKSLILAGWNAATHVYALDSAALGQLGLASFAASWLPDGLQLTDADAPSVDAEGTHIAVKGIMSYALPGSSSTATVSFGGHVQFDLTDPSVVALTVELDAQSVDWWSAFFPDLTNTDLGSLVLQDTPPGALFLATADGTWPFRQGSVALTPGLSAWMPVAIVSSFSGLAPLVAQWLPVVDFFGTVSLPGDGGYRFQLSANAPFSYAWSDYSLTFSAALLANGGNTLPSAAIALSASVTIGGQGAVSLSARYSALTGQLTFITATLPSSDTPISLADLGHLIPASVANDIAGALPQQVLSGIDSALSVFSLNDASLTVSLATPAVDAASIGLTVASGTKFSTPLITFPIGDTTLTSVSAQVSIVSPLSAPGIACTLSASGTLMNVPFAVSADNRTVRFVLQPDNTVPLDAFIHTLTGLDVSCAPHWSFAALGFDLTLPPTLTVSGALSPWSFTVGAWQFAVGTLDASLTITSGGATSGSFDGSVSVTDNGTPMGNSSLSVVAGNAWTGTFTLDLPSSGVLFQALAGVDIPLMHAIPLPNLVCTVSAGHSLAFDVEFGALAIPGQTFLSIASAKASFAYSPAGTMLSLTLCGSASGTWFSIDSFAVTMTYDSSAKTWCSTDTIKSKLFDHALDLQLSITGTPGSEKLDLTYDGNFAVITIDALAIEVMHLQITLAKTETALSFEFCNRFALALGSQPKVAGTLMLDVSNQAQSLVLQFDKGCSWQTTICTVGSFSPGFGIAMEQLQLSHDGSDWSASMTTGVALTGLPKFLYNMGILLDATGNTYPYSITVTASTGNGVSITIPRLVDAHEFDLKLDIAGISFALPAWKGAGISIGDVTGSFCDKPSIAFDMSVTLPSELAQVFGANPNIFSDQPFSMSFKMDFASGVTFSVNSIPFLDSLVSNVTTPQGPGWQLNLGDYGILVIAVPAFKLHPDSMSFQSSGWIQGIDTLRIPLKPLKTLLEKTPASVVAHVLPDDPIPLLRNFSFLDSQGNLDPGAAITLFSSHPWTTIIPSDVLAIITGALNALPTIPGEAIPDRLVPYLSVTFPNEFGWNVAIGTSGSLTLEFTVGARGQSANQPLRLLLPCFAGPPSLLGITFYGFSLGAVIAGALFDLTIDCDIDQFDLVDIGGSYLLKEDLPVPTCKQIQRTITIDSLYMLIFYEDAGIPIPIPLFFNELGLDYMGIEGVGLHGHTSFPMPQIGLGPIVQIFAALYDFCKNFPNQNFPDKVFESTDITFALKDWYLDVPQYLGGGIAGKRGPVVTLSAFKDAAEAFNALRTVDLLAIVAALPASVTSGNLSVKLLSIAVDAAWSIQAQSHPRSLTIALAGDCSDSALTSLSGSFTFAAADATGFSAHYSLSGTLAPLGMLIDGALIIDPHASPQFAVQGDSALNLFDYSVLSGTGSVAYQSGKLSLSESLSLFPSNMPFHIASSGWGAIGSDGFHYDCTASVSGLSIFPINNRGSDGVSISIDSSGNVLAIAMRGTLDWGGLGVTLSLSTIPSCVVFSGKVGGSVLGAFLSLTYDTNQGTAQVQLTGQTGSVAGTTAAALGVIFADAVGGAAGTFTASVGDFTIFSGSATDNGTNVGLSGSFHLLSLTTIGASGVIDGGTIDLSAQDTVSIDMWIVSTSFQVDISLNNNGVSLNMSGDVEVGFDIDGYGLKESFACSGSGTISAGPTITFSLSGNISIRKPWEPWDHMTITLSFTITVSPGGISVSDPHIN